MGDPKPLQIEHRWLLELARELVGHPQDAQDLAQDTWLRVMRSGREPGRVSRRWVAAVARKLALHVFRSRSRREHRESLSVAPEAGIEHRRPGDILDFEAAVAQLMSAVERLREPYRETVHLRYLEGLGVGQIAQRQDVPIETVRKRIVRALAQLRRIIRSETRGDLRASGMLVILGALLHETGDPPESVTPAAAAASGPGWIVGSIGALAAAASIAVFVATGSRTESDTHRAPSTLAQRPSPEVGLAFGESESARRSSASPGELLVLDEFGVPVAGETVRAVPLELLEATEQGQGTVVAPSGGRIVGTTDGDGRLSGVVVDEPVLLMAASHQLVTLFAPVVTPDSAPGPIVLSPATSVWGRAVDDENRPVVGARVRTVYAEELGVNPGFVSELLRGADTRLLEWETRTDLEGFFNFEHVSATLGAALEFELEGHATLRVPMEEVPPPQGAYFMLPRLHPDRERTDARLVDPSGRPIARARIGNEQFMTTSGSDGGFCHGLPEGHATRAWIAAPGCEPLLVDVVGGAGDLIRLRPAATLTGSVCDAAGEPLGGLRVLLADPTVVAVRNNFAFTAESVTSGASGELVGTETRADGAFRIDGLARRPYRLFVIHERAGLLLETEPLAVGQDHAIRLSENPWAVPFEGVVVDERGIPVAGARVTLHSIAKCESNPPNFNLRSGSVSGFETTAADGTFRWDNHSARIGTLSLARLDLGLVEVPPPLAGVDRTTFVLERRGLVMVQLEGLDADAVEVRDASDRPLEVQYREGWDLRIGPRVPVLEGQLSEFLVPLDARSVLALRDGVVLREHPISPRPGAWKEGGVLVVID